jgi:transposase
MEMNLQLHHVVSDITGATGMRIIRAIVAGERNPNVLTQSLELYDVYQAKMLDCDRKLES